MGAEHFDLQPLDATFGAVVTGMKLAEIDDGAFAELYDAWLDYALLIFPGQHLARDEQIAFARRFGPPEFEIAPISNVRADGSVRPEAIYDLPAGGRRLVQRAEGYCYTVKSGEVTFEDGEHTGALPGSLVRGGREARILS